MSSRAIILLLLALVTVLIGAVSGQAVPFAVGVASVIVALTAQRFAPRWTLFIFWCWLTAVLLYLVTQPPLESMSDTELGIILGLPAPTFWILIGIWLVPILIWPLSFLLKFRDWAGR